jgi:DNA-binding response OmpR family regulator
VSTKLQILLIEDDQDIAHDLRQLLGREGHLVTLANKIGQAFECIESKAFDLLIVDVGLPDGNGFEFCKAYRDSGGQAYVIFLTGQNSIEDKIRGLESEADDYITKPFDVRELCARIDAVCRRTKSIKHDILSHSNIKLDPFSRTVTARGKTFRLPPRECALLEFFLRHPDEIFTPEKIIESVWNAENGVSNESVRSAVAFLRKRFKANALPDLIENIHSQGYRLRAIVDSE